MTLTNTLLDPTDASSQGWPVEVEVETLLTVTDPPFKVIASFCEGADPPVCTLKLNGFTAATRFEVEVDTPTCNITCNVPLTVPFDWVGPPT